jgi:hypothetical protein
VNLRKKDKKTGEVIKKPICIVEWSKYAKGVDRANHYLSCYSVLKKIAISGPKKLFVLNYAVFSAFFTYKTLNQNSKYKKFFHEVGRARITENHTTSKSSSDNAQPPVLELTKLLVKQNCKYSYCKMQKEVMVT